MKTKKLKLLTTFLLLLTLCVVLLGAGCDDNQDNGESISLEYTKCPCDSKMDFIKEITMDKILLFDTTKTTFTEMKELSSDGDTSKFVCYNPESNNAVFYNYYMVFESVFYICNFPETDSEWEIPSDGMYISFTADIFDPCNYIGGIESYSESEIVLTSLKKYDK
jgi:hypothetical protein